MNRTFSFLTAAAKLLPFLMLCGAGGGYAQVPVINSVSPQSGPVGTGVTITGTNFQPFAPNNVVYFGAEKATVLSANATSISVTAPAGANCQPVTVLANGLTGSSQQPFIITFNDAPFSAASFNPKIDLASGSGVYGVAVKDLDGDGKPDIVAVNSSSQTVSFFKNNSKPGTAVFTQALVKTVSGYSVGVATGDLDGDGKPDVVVTNMAAGTILMYKNTSTNGILSFDDPVTLQTEPNPYNVVIADFNGDGKLDLAVTYNNSFPGTAAVFTNLTVSGAVFSFSAGRDLATNDDPRGIFAADIDGDGLQDIVVSCQGSALSVFHNTSAGGIIGFASGMTVNMPSGSSPESTVIIDLDGDLKPDVAVANNNVPGTITVLKNNSSPGTIAFLPQQQFSTGVNPFSIATADINGDGKPDIAVADQTDNTATVLINNSSGGQISFTNGINFKTGQQPRSIFAGDIDGDGKPDLVVGNIDDNNLSLILATTSPSLVDGPLSGNIAACAGSPSYNPSILQFTISGSNLTGSVTVSAPAGFEVSSSPDSGYEISLIFPQSGGTLAGTIIYVRSAATALAGAINGDIILSTPDGTNQPVSVTAEINALPVVNNVTDQIVVNGSSTSPVNFSGTGTDYTWTNDNPSIGLAASGTGDIASFSAINNGSVSVVGNTPVIATITVVPQSSAGCSGQPVSFTITVDPKLPVTVAASGNLTPFSTIYGSPSASQSFMAAGTGLTAGILVTPPPGYEVSTDNVHFVADLTLGSTGTVTSTPVYLRLAATTHTGDYPGDIVLSAGPAFNATVTISDGSVSPASLTITADNQSRIYRTTNPALAVSYRGFQNSDGPGQLTTLPMVTTSAQFNSPIGIYPITVAEAASPDYSFTYVAGTLTIRDAFIALGIPNTFTPNGDGINDIWNITGISIYPNCSVKIFNRLGQQLYFSIGYSKAWDGTYRGQLLPSGTYYYVIDPKNGSALYSGYVAIIR